MRSICIRPRQCIQNITVWESDRDSMRPEDNGCRLATHGEQTSISRERCLLMPRREPLPEVLDRRAHRRNAARKPLKLLPEPLESRIMLDGGGVSSSQLPPAIVVGR